LPRAQPITLIAMLSETLRKPNIGIVALLRTCCH
jgi:hypothetical protein